MEQFLAVVPVLPSQDIQRDVEWYEKFTGFTAIYNDNMYAVLRRDELSIHLQWHADTDADPLFGGSVIRLRVESIQPILQEFIERATVEYQDLRLKTAWETNEFGFFDLNRNAIFIVEYL